MCVLHADLSAFIPVEISFSAHLSVVLADPAPWDKDHHYQCGTVGVYYEGGAGQGLVHVPLNSTLNEVLSSGTYV